MSIILMRNEQASESGWGLPRSLALTVMLYSLYLPWEDSRSNWRLVVMRPDCGSILKGTYFVFDFKGEWERNDKNALQNGST